MRWLFYHCSSTDNSPKFDLCPKLFDSWFFDQKSIANEEKPPSHKTIKVHFTLLDEQIEIVKRQRRRRKKERRRRREEKEEKANGYTTKIKCKRSAGKCSHGTKHKKPFHSQSNFGLTNHPYPNTYLPPVTSL